MRSFPMRVTDPNGTVHSFVYIDDIPTTTCGQPCGTWTVMVGGDPTCRSCQEANLRTALRI